MKCSVLVCICFAFASLGWTQTATPSDHAQMHAQHQEHTETMCKQMMAEHVADIKTTSQALATNLAQLKATLPLINDINERSRWQSNIAMWQALSDHFDRMAKHPEHMEEMGRGCGMMPNHAKGERKNHEHSQPATPVKPQ